MKSYARAPSGRNLEESNWASSAVEKILPGCLAPGVRMMASSELQGLLSTWKNQKSD